MTGPGTQGQGGSERLRQVAAFVATAALVLLLALAARGAEEQVRFAWSPPKDGAAVASYEIEALCSSSPVVARIAGDERAVPLTLDWRRVGTVSEASALLELVYSDRIVGLRIRVRGISAAGKPGPYSQASDPWPQSIGPGKPGRPEITR